MSIDQAIHAATVTASATSTRMRWWRFIGDGAAGRGVGWVRAAR
jgi:hypothetical protein